MRNWKFRIAMAVAIWLYALFSGYRLVAWDVGRPVENFDWVLVGLLVLAGGYAFATAMYMKRRQEVLDRHDPDHDTTTGDDQ